MTDLADIKARLEAHKAHVAELGWSRDVPAETWARDVQTLLDDNEALREALEEARKDFDRICHNCALPQDQDLYFLADSGRDSVEQALAALKEQS